jgi:mono/diheme cytochrome c family protein
MRSMAMALGMATLLGCRQDMADQPRAEPLEPSRFFADGQSARPPVPGAVARGELRADTHLYTGLTDAAQRALEERAEKAENKNERALPSLERRDDYVADFPFAVTADVMGRGRERYQIFCTPCHDASGGGAGVMLHTGYPKAESFHTDRLRDAPPGYLFDVITRGYGAMPSYASQVTPRDCWAIIAYIRALQLSRHAEFDNLPAELRKRFEE